MVSQRLHVLPTITCSNLVQHSPQHSLKGSPECPSSSSKVKFKHAFPSRLHIPCANNERIASPTVLVLKTVGRLTSLKTKLLDLSTILSQIDLLKFRLDVFWNMGDLEGLIALHSLSNL